MKKWKRVMLYMFSGEKLSGSEEEGF